MRWTLALAVAGVLAATLSACGGGGSGDGSGGPSVNRPSEIYGGLSYTLASGCAFAVGNTVTLGSSASTVENSARRSCTLIAQDEASGGSFPPCRSRSFQQCVAVGVGQNSSGNCNISPHGRRSLSEARSAALQNCRSVLGSSATCEVLVSGCASGGPEANTWRPSGGSDSNGSNASAWAADCIETRQRQPGSSAVTVQNNCSFDVEVRGACTPTSSTALSHPPGTYSLAGGWLYTIRAGSSSADVSLALCWDRDRTSHLAACRKPYIPHFTSSNGSRAACFG